MNLILGDFLIAVVHSIYNEDQRATFTICILSFQHEKKGVHARVYVEVFCIKIWYSMSAQLLVIFGFIIYTLSPYSNTHCTSFLILQNTPEVIWLTSRKRWFFTSNKRIQYGINIVYNVIYMVLHTEFYVILKLMNNQSEIN